ncbi:hypothetical protein PF004_g1853 [Phytophthora fragariae]|uniref:Uncharacterized protein n=1 Tax=Phytophthora fragariae TaxID=53985 RepID=A0A6G0PRM9_9STRA|nr:hypothetical protein PF004_g1853 [Phytophthora fragariae]
MLRLQHQSSPEPIQWAQTPPGSYGPLPPPSPSTSLRSSWQTVEPPSLSPPSIPFPLRQFASSPPYQAASSPPHPLASLPPYLRVPSLSHPAAPEPPLRAWSSPSSSSWLARHHLAGDASPDLRHLPIASPLPAGTALPAAGQSYQPTPRSSSSRVRVG